MVLVEVRNLSKKFGEKEALKNINIKVESGEVLALIGPTGAGKTTLLRLIDLLDMPTSGRIYFDDTDVTQLGKVGLETRRRMAFVSQKPVVFNTTVYNNIAYGLKWRGVGKSSIRQKVDNILEMVNLSDHKNRNAGTLSGGEAQRVAIARAIAVEPEVLLLDEPTANLDPISTSRIEELITNIIHRYGTTIVMTTHDMAQGQRLADRIVVLINGEVHQVGERSEVFAFPRDREVAEFVGMKNIFLVEFKGSKAWLQNLEVELGREMKDAQGYLAIRPEDIVISRERLSSSMRNNFRGVISKIIREGFYYEVQVKVGWVIFKVLITGNALSELDLREGASIYLAFKSTAIHTFQ